MIQNTFNAHHMKTPNPFLMYSFALSFALIPFDTSMAKKRSEEIHPAAPQSIAEAVKQKSILSLGKLAPTDPKETRPDGEPAKAHFYNEVFDEFSKVSQKEEPLWLRRIESTLNKGKFTKEDVMLFATIYRTFAWRHRGPEYYHKVPPNEMEVFHKYSQRALEMLNQEAQNLADDPEYYRQRILTERGNGGSQKSASALAEKGLKIAPGYYSLYTSALVDFYHQWGGSINEMNEFIIKTKKQLPPKYSNHVQARAIHSAILDGRYSVLAKGSPVDWSTTLASFEAIYREYPSTMNAQKYFMAACYRSDKKNALKYLELSGVKFMESAVGSDTSTAEMCKDWATGRLEGFVLRVNSSDESQAKEDLLIN
jgi:hypothetical protein